MKLEKGEIILDSPDNKVLQYVLDNTNEGIHIVDEAGKTIVYNKKMAELENMEQNFVLNKNLLEVFPSLNEESSTLLSILKNGEKIKNNQQEYLNKSGQKVTTINTTIPIKVNNKRWALEIARDITDIKNLYQKIIKLQEKLYKTNNLDINNQYFTFKDIIGEDKKLKKVIEYSQQAAKTDSSVLIVGKTGTGKELFAQSIHNESRRNNKPFIAQNCAALPENLLEGILFGTRRGGFTGAVNRKGLFEQANKGTLLLDEINSMSTALQAKLLRVLQEGTIRPVGGKKDIRVDLRIIATINTSPVTAIKNGNLREDLYYRLGVVLLYLPVLAERGSDVFILSNHFIDVFNEKFNCHVKGLDDDVKEIFLEYSWPGNVRQLEHVIEGAMNIIGDNNLIKPEHVKPFLLKKDDNTKNNEEVHLNESNEIELNKSDSRISLPKKLNKIEKKIIIDALEKTNGNITRAARKLGLKRQSLQYRINKHKINIDIFG